MRHNPQHAETDPAIVRRLIAENPWGTLVSRADGLVASHYPILLDESSDELAIVTHVGRPDEQLHQFGSEEMLLIIAGPQVLARLRGSGPYASPALADDMERALR